MPLFLPDPYSSHIRPALRGARAAVSAAHPLAASAALEVMADGGNAADAAIAAQAVIAVLLPEAAGLGGDGFFLVRAPNGAVTAVNAAGAAPAGLDGPIGDDGSSVTVPGLVMGWSDVSRRFGAVSLARALAPAQRLAASGASVRAETVRAVHAQKARLVRGGAESWPFFAVDEGTRIRQPALAETLEGIGTHGARWFYEGAMAHAISAAVRCRGGALSAGDLAAHDSVVTAPLSLAWQGGRIHVQPPVSQGVLLLMALNAYARLAPPAAIRQHALIELTQAAFAFRDRAGEGAALLAEPLPVDLARASLRGGPRSYLHTAGVATADVQGMVVSSLVSVFDDFGSAIYVPEGGFVLNNRAAGFTGAPNHARPGALPVHTLAPILVDRPEGCLALATPGADGQVQTLLQILIRVFEEGCDLPSAIDGPRWRSEDGRLLLEGAHAGLADLQALGHRVVPTPAGDTRFGAVVCAGLADGMPFAVSDWRRETWSAAC
ncbi:gamma-glutamyltransferase [Xanthobacter sp. KR7-65]|uniref:gamma-glutamyltransferase n=1 Tax=Xanthobacter sp. KR7-65 TaxID=3156612 RepID=UPI0032B4E7A6